MNKQDIIISLLKEIDKNIDNVNDSGGINANLKELTVTYNGEYLPVDYDADGFSKVTVRFDTSSLSKIKISALGVSKDCINEYGRWDGEYLIDISNCDNLVRTFYNNENIVSLDANNWDTSQLQSIEQVFMGCTKLTQLNVSNWNTSKITNMSYAFRAIKTNSLDLTKWDTSNVINFSYMFQFIRAQYLDLSGLSAKNATNVNYMFEQAYSLTSIVGNKTIDYVINNNVCVFEGLRISNDMRLESCDRASLRAVINGLADLTGESSQTLILRSTVIDKLTEEDIAIATAKNWTIA